jgi:hypothetical protein
MLCLEVTNEDFRAELPLTFLLHSLTDLILLRSHNKVHSPLPEDFVSAFFILRMAVKYTVTIHYRHYKRFKPNHLSRGSQKIT